MIVSSLVNDALIPTTSTKSLNKLQRMKYHSSRMKYVRISATSSNVMWYLWSLNLLKETLSLIDASCSANSRILLMWAAMLFILLILMLKNCCKKNSRLPTFLCSYRVSKDCEASTELSALLTWRSCKSYVSKCIIIPSHIDLAISRHLLESIQFQKVFCTLSETIF